MQEQSIKKNYLYNTIYQILSLIIPLIVTPYVSRVLGASGLGVYSYTLSIVTYFTLFAAMGTATYGQREISYYRDDKYVRSLKFWNTELLSCCSVLCTLVVYFFFIFFQRENRIFYLILSINIITIAVDITWFFQGLEQFGKIVARNIIFKIINLIYILVFVKEKSDLYIYIFGISFFSLLSALSLWPYLRKLVVRIPLREIHPFNDIKTVWSLFIPTIAISVYSVMDKTMIGWITHSNVQNGYYEQSITIVRFLLTFVTSLGTVMIPRIGYCYEKGETQRIIAYMKRSYSFVWFLGLPMFLGLISVADIVVPWFLGAAFVKAVPIVKVLAFLFLAVGINNVTGMQFLITTKRQNLFTITVIIGAISNFVLNSLLIPRFMALGAALGSIIAESIIAIVQLFCVRKELNLKIVFSPGSWKYFLASFLMCIFIRYIRIYCKKNFLFVSALIVSGVLIYFLCLLLMRENIFLPYLEKRFKRQ